MLEDGGVLLTWSLMKLPTAGGEAVAAERLSEHRLDYLTYEGPVSGERGAVRRVDAGTFEWVERSPERLVVTLAGATLCGSLVVEVLIGGARMTLRG
jgi:hypothetical protein